MKSREPIEGNSPRPHGERHRGDERRSHLAQHAHSMAHHQAPVHEQCSAYREREDGKYAGNSTPVSYACWKICCAELRYAMNGAKMSPEERV